MKIGRNEKCPCGSGKKYKRCCAGRQVSLQENQEKSTPVQKKVTLGGAIAEIQAYAKDKVSKLLEVGVFLLYSDSNGDAWVLEITDSDCIQVASGGEVVEINMEEDDETIMVNWTHQFSFKNKQVHLSAYRTKEHLILENAPSQQLYASMRKLLKKFSPEMLNQVHVSEG